MIAAARAPALHRGAGPVCSLLLHVVMALLIILGLPNLLRPALQPPLLVPVDLVQWGERTTSPAAEREAAVPQQRAAETALVEAPAAVPVPQAAAPAPAPAPAATPERTKPEPRAATHPPRPPAAVNPLTARLQALARLHQPAAPVEPAPRQQSGSGSSNLTASDNAAARGPQAAYSIKDFLRAQIERHWTMEQAVARIPDAVVLIHLGIGRDGKVRFAEVVPDSRYQADAALRELAYSARNAVLMASPLTLPPGSHEQVRDVTLDFRPRDVLR